MTQVTDIQAGVADGSSYYDWSVAQNWNNGVPQDGADANFDRSLTSLDNIANLTLNEYYIIEGSVRVGAVSLTIADLELFPNFGTVSLEAESGASVNIQSLYDPSNESDIIADAGGAITYEATTAGTQINSFIEIEGASGGVAGGVVSIGSGYSIETTITLEAAGATLDLDDSTYLTPVTGTGGVVNLNSAYLALSGGANVVNFLSGYYNIADLSGTNGNWDVVYGSNGSVNLTSAQVSIVGDDNAVTADAGSWISLYNTAGYTDEVSGSGVYVILSSAQVDVVGGSDAVTFVGADDVANLSATSGNWDAVYGSNGTVSLNSAQAAIVGDDDIVYASDDSYVSLYGGTTTPDFVVAEGSQVIVNGGQAEIVGFENSITATTGSILTLATLDDAWDAVYGSNISVSVSGAGDDAPGGGLAAIVGGDDVVTVTPNSVVSLLDTGSSWDTLDDSTGTIILTDAKATLTGGTDVIWATGASAISLTGAGGTWDVLYATGAEVDLVNGQAGEPLASILGGGNTITATGSAYMSLYQTSSNADTVTASNGIIALTDAQASLSGSNDAIDFVGASALTVSGASETFGFAAEMGTASIAGFVASDSLHLNSADWSDFAALQNSGDLTQVGNDAVIRLDGSNAITLTGVTASTLTAANFNFSSYGYA
jgi:hypothetical protein